MAILRRPPDSAADGPRPERDDPASAVLSGTSVRFAVLVLVITVSTGSIFGYLWQLSHPGLQAQARSCLRTVSTGPLAGLIGQAAESASRGMEIAGCVRSDTPAMTAWSLAGIGLLIAMTLVLYWLTPWWIVNVGRPGSGPLRPLDPGKHPDLARFLHEQVRKVGVQPCPAFFIDWADSRTEAARAFGRHRRPCVRLTAGVVAHLPESTDDLLHELAHLRNRDNLPTYLTLSAWRAFAMLIPAAYVIVLTNSGVSSATVDPRLAVAVVMLTALVALSVSAVMRNRELHADATAAFYHPVGSLPALLRPAETAAAQAFPATAPPARAWRPRFTRVVGWLRALRYTPDLHEREEALAHPEKLDRVGSLTMVSAGVAIAIIMTDVTPVVFSALLGTLPRTGSWLLSGQGNSPLTLLILVYGPAVLIAAGLGAALACAVTWRLESRAARTATLVRPAELARLALAMAAGMLAGVPLGFDYLLVGNWGVFDTSATRNLIVTAISGADLAVLLAILFAWASEHAAAWYTTIPRRARVVRGIGWAAGALGAAPMFFAWTAAGGQRLITQLQIGPDAGGQHRLIGWWPAASALFTHVTVLGSFDIVPGGAFLLALPFVVVAARSLRPAHLGVPDTAWGSDPPARTPLGSVLAAGLAAAGISVVAGVALMSALRPIIGPKEITAAGGYGLLYLTRALEILIACCAGLGAAWAVHRAERAHLTTAVLTAMVTVGAAAPFAPQIIAISELGWPHPPLSARAERFLYAAAGNMTPGKAVVAALLLGAVSTALTRLVRPGTSPTVTSSGCVHRTRHRVTRLIAATVLAAVLAGQMLAAYYFFTLGFT